MPALVRMARSCRPAPACPSTQERTPSAIARAAGFEPTEGDRHSRKELPAQRCSDVGTSRTESAPRLAGSPL